MCFVKPYKDRDLMEFYVSIYSRLTLVSRSSHDYKSLRPTQNYPRRFGLACHLGVLRDQPTIGAAKFRLVGTHDELSPEKGAWVPLWDQGEIIGAVVRTRTNVKPLYISAGHRISLCSAIDVVLTCTPKYRLPETTRWADKLAASPVDD